VPNRKTRNRQLARVAQRRYEERRRQRRRRTQIVSAVIVVALVVLGLGTYIAVANRGTSAASPTPSSSASPSPGKQPVACGASVPKAASVKKPTFKKAPPMTIDPSKTYTATIETSCGTVVVKLLADQAPQTVNSFVFLANKHFFDGTKIHRIDTSIGIIQGGDPTGTGTGGPGYTIPDELTGNETYGPGVVAMANGGPNTGGSQFFIVYDKNGHKLDANPNYTIFGRVVKGLDVVKRIAQIPVPNASGGPGPGQTPERTIYLNTVAVSAG
jgi:cyclophilin family peptidyl-prolyl cis-trans isomerase